MILPSLILPREVAHLIQHVVNKYSVPRGGVVDQDMGDRTDELAVLDQGEPDRSAVRKGQQKSTEI